MMGSAAAERRFAVGLCAGGLVR